MTIKPIKIFLLCTCLLTAAVAVAQREMPAFTTTRIDQSDGLCENMVTNILQDHVGFIWVATWDGIARYDGSRLVTFKSWPCSGEHPMPSNRITRMAVNSDGNIWCLVGGRVFLFMRNGQRFHAIDPQCSLPLFHQIVETKGAKTRFLTADGICYEMADAAPFRVRKVGKVNMSDEQYAVCKASSNTYLYYADRNGQLFARRLHTKQTERVAHPEGVSSVLSIVRYDAKRVLMSTNHGVYVINSPQDVRPLAGYETQRVRSMCVDRQGNIWLSDYPGFVKLSPIKTLARPQKMIPSEEEEIIRGVTTDRHGHIWAADKNGFVRVAADGQLLYLTADGQLVSDARRFSIDRKDNVYCCMEDHQGNIWLGTKANGLYCLQPQGPRHFAMTHYTTADGLPHSSVYALAEDGLHRIWVGTNGGGICWMQDDERDDSNVYRIYKMSNNYPAANLEVKSLCSMKNGVMLVGTTDGLLTFSTQTANPHFYVNRLKNQPHSISSNRVMQVVCTKRDKVFLATFGGGLNMVADEQLLSNNLHFQQVNTLQGLPSDACLSLVVDNNDRLWVVNEMAISRYDTQTRQLTNYSTRELGGNFQFSEGSPARWGQCLLFATTQGLLFVDVNKMEKSTYSPPVCLSRVIVEGEARCQDFNVDSLLVLSKHERSVVFEFASLDYSRSASALYRYRIVGLNDQWKTIHDASVSVANIPPGDYTLEVMSTNGDGVWGKQVRRLAIHVEPSFSETLWAKLLYTAVVLLFGWIVYVIVRYVYRLRAQIEDAHLAANEKMERLSQRLHELVGSKTSLEELHTDVPEELLDRQRMFTDQLMAYMNQNIDRPTLQVGDIAEYMGMSKTQLYMKMKEALGCTPLTLVNDLRIKKAEVLLRAGHDVSSTAYACGFSDPHYFSRCFRKSRGCSPTEYIANCHKQQNDAEQSSQAAQE